METFLRNLSVIKDCLDLDWELPGVGSGRVI